MKILYKKDSKNKIRYLIISSSKETLIQESGVLGTSNPIIHKKACIGKNISKSNETSPSEQAILEMNSIIKDKLTHGYFENLEDAVKEEVILPMLALSYEDEKHKIDWNNCFVQPKLDGMRCLAHIKSNGDVKLISRDGKIIENMDHIIKDLSKLKKDIILDGELYCHELSFQENMKLIKKYRKNKSENIKYHLYDTVSKDSFCDRWNNINSDLDFEILDEIIYVPTFMIKSEKKLKKYHTQFINECYEGSIIRHGSNGYKTNGRSSNLLKYKDFQDITAKIIDIIPNEANSLHGTPILKYINGVNITVFKAGVKMSHEDREDLLKNKSLYIGQTAEIRFFDWTDAGNPRFPIMVGIRLDK